MKSFLFLLLIITGLAASANTYYFSESGNDANNGTSPSTPWKSLSKFNSVFASKTAGDNFLFKKGDVFYGNMAISKSGTSALSMSIGAYGTGANPVISGFASVSAWTNLGSNVWESTSAVSTLATLNMVAIGGVNTAMGRTPNYPTYYNWKTVTSTSLTSTNLNSATTNWTGAELVDFVTTYTTARHTVTAHSGSTLNYNTSNPDPNNQTPGSYFTAPFFIQNDTRTLDVQNEWYYNPSTKKIRIYSTSSPTNVQVATIDNLVTMGGHPYITFDGISFTGSNGDAILLSSAPHVTVKNCDFNYIGRNVLFDGGGSSKVDNCTINNCNNFGIDFKDNGSDTVTNNTIKNIGMLVGMGAIPTPSLLATGISAYGNNAVITNNIIDSTGLLGMRFGGDNSLIKNNFVQRFCYANGVKDGGGLYMYHGGAGNVNTNVQLIGNISINGGSDGLGIYFDDYVNGILCQGNTTANCRGGYQLHNVHNLVFRDNTSYNSTVTEMYLLMDDGSANNSTNITLKNNILFPKNNRINGDNWCLWNNVYNSTIMPAGFTSDSNYFARPINSGSNLMATFNVPAGTYTSRDLPSWQGLKGTDAHSHISPKTITDLNDLRFEYNATMSPVTISLPFKYIDVKNAVYNGTITLQPFTSAVLIKNGAITGNVSPVAQAGTDQTITLPTNSITLSGSGTDAGGTISSYNWTKISGPSAGTITTIISAATTVSGLAQGVYQFQLKVTDNNGATGVDTVQITVNAAANIAPTANAGTDQSITLPTNNVSLSGSGNDADGTIASYSWTKISGPSAGTVTTGTSAATTATGLVQGVYQFQLQVTDNNGATAVSTVQITVNAAANIAPTANAGADQSITLPTNNVSLSGTGNDADGTIASYNWTKISGPSAGTITTIISANTTATGLVQGVYQFQLQVTDNNGATAVSTVQITVNAAANIAPTADAGADQSITLPTNIISLNGSGNDPDGTIASYNWTKISGPSAGTITTNTSAATTVTGLVQGVYQFQLQVTDNNGATAVSTVQITVTAAANIAPTANAGTDQSITLPTNNVSLSGTGSDADGSIASYNWTKTSGPWAGTITTIASAGTTVTGLVQGVYLFQLQVTDNNGATAVSTVQITVTAAANIAPTANAGTDQSITLPTNTISLNGSGNDADGTIAFYNWTKISGPSAGTITTITSAATTVTGLVQGVYQFQLQVTDNNGATALSTVQIAVTAAANIAPTANAGIDQSIPLPTNNVSLSGTGSDADGTIASYNWTKISGPSAGTITTITSAATTVTGMVQGIYQFQLKVADNNGATATNAVQITVTAAANIAPTANAGLDQSITLPTNNVSLSGIGNDADGSIASYNWTKISGPSAGTITAFTSAATTVTGLVQGVYQFQLKVADNNGATATNAVQITVTAAANIAPTANAGIDQSITLPTNNVSLSGSGNDADGTIASYNWTKISGPSGGTITTIASAATTVTTLVQGVYQFQLQVTDNNGATATNAIQITVNAAANIAPTANAGIDQSITLPTNNVSLSGSGTDADGTIASYNWTKISGPSAGTITTIASAATTVTTLVQGVYQFQLKVTDNKGATAVNTVQITVNAAGNIAPTANAGIDQSIALPKNNVSLSGSGNDADGTIASYNWTKISGPSTGTITTIASAATTVTTLVQGVYRFQLKVTDNKGATALDIVQVTVNAAGNIAPTANAGANQSITLPTNFVFLYGKGTDADGTIASYKWTKISGPTPGTITVSNYAITAVTGLVQGVYLFQLKVADNKAATAADTIQVTVNTANLPPTANAGLDKSITLPTNAVSLNGSGTDADGTIASYKWTRISGPLTGTVTNATSAATTVTRMVQGVYRFQLKVTDNKAATAMDTIQITVNAANARPTASAGIDQTIALPDNITSLAGSGSDQNGTIVTYNWTKLSGPASYNIVNPSSPVTDVAGLVQGVYTFELKVTDNDSSIGLDTVQITTNAVGTILLPLDLLSFKGQLVNDKVSLTWKTADEKNVSGFEIEKMTGNMWVKIGYRQSTNGSLAENDYSFSDSLPLTGLNYYRLKIVDADGKFVYSNVVSIELKIARNMVYQNFPNPFTSTTTIRYDLADKAPVKIMVFNAAGVQVAVLANETKQPGSYFVQWNASNLAHGNYFYTVIIGEKVITKKMLKIN